MKVVINGKTYCADEIPIILVLSDKDKENISNMIDEHFVYCGYPKEGWTQEEILELIKQNENVKEKEKEMHLLAEDLVYKISRLNKKHKDKTCKLRLQWIGEGQYAIDRIAANINERIFAGTLEECDDMLNTGMDVCYG